jgi:hypothetical protein
MDKVSNEIVDADDQDFRQCIGGASHRKTWYSDQYLNWYLKWYSFQYYITPA